MPITPLAQVPYFAPLSAVGQRRLAEGAHRRSYQAGAPIFLEGGRCAGLHVVAEGLVRLYRLSPEGRPHTLGLLRPPTIFNEVAAVDGGPNPFNATAVTDATLWAVSHSFWMELLASEPALLRHTLQGLATLNRDYLERLEDMTFRSIPARLAKLFLHELGTDSIAEAPSKLTQEEIASILGTSREVVGRALRGLLNAGLLRKQGRTFYVQDYAGLEHLAQNDCLPEGLNPRDFNPG